MSKRKVENIKNLPRRAVEAVALYLIFHFTLILAYSALGSLWPPLALIIPVVVLLTIYRRTTWRFRYPFFYKLGKLIYWLWTIAFIAGVAFWQYLVDRWILVAALAAAFLSRQLFNRQKLGWCALPIVAAAIGLVALHEPWLVNSTGRLIFGAVLFSSLALLFIGEQRYRVTNLEFAVFALLTPMICSLAAFYQGYDLATSRKIDDTALTFLYAAGDIHSPQRVRDGKDLRFAITDCNGNILLGGGAKPGLERLGEKQEVVDEQPTGDNLISICRGREGLLYGTRTGYVVFRPSDGYEKHFNMEEPVLIVQADTSHYRAFAMTNWNRVVTLSLPNLGITAEHSSGVNIDLLYAPSTRQLYHSVLFKGIEVLEPATLKIVGDYPMPYSVGGTLAYDDGNRRLYASDWLGTQIHVLDLRDIVAVAYLTVERGIRKIVYDRKRDLLLAGSYFRGDVLVYRPYIGGEPLRIHVGRRVRDLYLDGDRCLGVSAAGVFSIDLNDVNERLSW